jgi:hypothetical protein
LCGQFSDVGFRSYFPLAFVFKTPVATLVALTISLVISGRLGFRRFRAGRAAAAVAVAIDSPLSAWSIACILIPLAALAASVLTANLNIGLRHMLSVVPFLDLIAACGVGYAWRHWGRQARVVVIGLAAALAIETAAAFPDYIAFFNAAAGGSRGGLKLLGDSNLDWGQDLKLLAEWQRRHPERNLYLCYFGTAEPEYYGIRYDPLPGTFSPKKVPAATPMLMPTQPGVIAISATNLQGIYLSGDLRRLYAPLKDQTPLEVLGGSIYLFEYDPR